MTKIDDTYKKIYPSLQELIELINYSDQEDFVYITLDGDYYEIISLFATEKTNFKIRTSYLYPVGDSNLLLASDANLSFDYNYMDVTEYWKQINKKEFIDAFNGYLELLIRINREDKTVEIQITRNC